MPLTLGWISCTEAIPSRDLSNLLLQALEGEDARLSGGMTLFFAILITTAFVWCNWIAFCHVLSTMAIK